MHLPEEPETPLAINIVPAIDVIFAILAFFIISTLFLTRSQSLPINLPEALTAQTQQENSITVTIQANGEIALNRQRIERDRLAAQLQQQIESDSDTLVLVNADEQVPHGQVVAIMDILRQIKGVRLAIAVENP